VSVEIDVLISAPLATSVFQLLGELLLQGPQPAQLRSLVVHATTADPASLRDFADGLRRWERPNRREKLISLYQRARAKAHRREAPGTVVARLWSLRAPATSLVPPGVSVVQSPGPGQVVGSATAGHSAHLNKWLPDRTAV